jgi:DNA-binding NarL/FixJ family response regulator
VRVVVLATFDLDEHAALRAGANAFLLKDAKESQLLATILVAQGSLFARGHPAIDRSLHTGGASQPRVSLPSLTARELEVLELVARGLSNVEIAEHLVISEHPTKTHGASLLQKLG